MARRAVIVVLDSMGVGALPDAAEYGDAGSDTFGNILKVRGKINAPNMYKLGLCKIDGVSFYQNTVAEGCFGKCKELSKAKDTTVGHWEIAGLLAPKLQTFPNGFPDDIIQTFSAQIGRGVLGNCVASGTEIIARLGDAHVQSGKPIVYTSADSVFQIAAHEAVIPPDMLYGICKIAREILVGPRSVGRVIARPFEGTSGNYKRTENRRDFSLEPPGGTILDGIHKLQKDVIAIGKIEDIFCMRGITRTTHTTNNHTGIDATIRAIQDESSGLIFTNLVDMDMLYGHRNDVEGYAASIEEFDARLPEIIACLKEDDLLIITADHGCDPTTSSTDHSREYIPVLCCGKKFLQDVNLGIRNSFADIGSTVYEYVSGDRWPVGTSFLSDIIK